MNPRTFNALLGAWLFISAFLWRHSAAQMTNTWILGLLCIGFAVIAAPARKAQYLNTALAIWLFVSAFTLPGVSLGTQLNNAVVAVAVFVASLLPSSPLVTPEQTRPPTQPPHAA